MTGAELETLLRLGQNIQALPQREGLSSLWVNGALVASVETTDTHNEEHPEHRARKPRWRHEFEGAGPLKGWRCQFRTHVQTITDRNEVMSWGIVRNQMLAFLGKCRSLVTE